MNNLPLPTADLPLPLYKTRAYNANGLSRTGFMGCFGGVATLDCGLLLQPVTGVWKCGNSESDVCLVLPLQARSGRDL